MKNLFLAFVIVVLTFVGLSPSESASAFVRDGVAEVEIFDPVLIGERVDIGDYVEDEDTVLIETGSNETIEVISFVDDPDDCQDEVYPENGTYRCVDSRYGDSFVLDRVGEQNSGLSIRGLGADSFTATVVSFEDFDANENPDGFEPSSSELIVSWLTPQDYFSSSDYNSVSDKNIYLEPALNGGEINVSSYTDEGDLVAITMKSSMTALEVNFYVDDAHSCPGVEFDVGSYYLCRYTTDREEFVVGPLSSYESNVWLRAVGPESSMVSLVTFSDYNGNNEPDAFEGASRDIVASWLSPNDHPFFASMELLPPSAGDRSMTLWVDMPTPLNVYDIEVVFHTCNLSNICLTDTSAIENTRSLGGGWHELEAELAGSAPLGSRFKVSIAYKDDYNSFLLSNTDWYDFSSIPSFDMRTLVTAGTVTNQQTGSLDAEQVRYELNRSSGSFDVEFELTSRDQPLANQEVHILIDKHDIYDDDSLLIDGVSQGRDRYMLKRITDENGKVSLSVSNSDYRAGDVLEINYVVLGASTIDFRTGVGELSILWPEPMPSLIFTLDNSRFITPGTYLFPLYVYVTDGLGNPVEDLPITVGAGPAIEVPNSTVVTNSQGRITLYPRTLTSALSRGESFIQLSAMFEGELHKSRKNLPYSSLFGESDSYFGFDDNFPSSAEQPDGTLVVEKEEEFNLWVRKFNTTGGWVDHSGDFEATVYGPLKLVDEVSTGGQHYLKLEAVDDEGIGIVQVEVADQVITQYVVVGDGRIVQLPNNHFAYLEDERNVHIALRDDSYQPIQDSVDWSETTQQAFDLTSSGIEGEVGLYTYSLEKVGSSTEVDLTGATSNQDEIVVPVSGFTRSQEVTLPPGDYGFVSAWTKDMGDGTAKVYVKFPTIGEKVRIGHQTGGSGSYETIFVKTIASQADSALVVNANGSYIVRTIDLEDINRIRVTVGDDTLVQVRYNQ